MISRSREYVFCIGTGYTGGKFQRNFGGLSWRSGCWRYRRPIEGGMIPGNGWYGPGIGPGHTGGNLGRENAWKNKIKLRILLVWDAPQSFWSDSELILQDFVREIRFRAQKKNLPRGKIF